MLMIMIMLMPESHFKYFTAAVTVQSDQLNRRRRHHRYSIKIFYIFATFDLPSGLRSFLLTLNSLDSSHHLHGRRHVYFDLII